MLGYLNNMSDRKLEPITLLNNGGYILYDCEFPMSVMAYRNLVSDGWDVPLSELHCVGIYTFFFCDEEVEVIL